jgi:uncharacterized membrane protein
MEKVKNTKYIYLLLFIAGISLFSYLGLKDTAIPYDDAYSAFMIKSSYADIVRITAKDVHPPLYYWGLKAFSSLFGESIFTLRLFSLSGVLAVLLLGCFPIRKLFGDRVAIHFILLLLFFPVTQYLATDIRMYSWSMFLVLACAVYAYKIYTGGKFRNWVLFFITGICAAYTHNYGLLSVLGIYALLLISLIPAKEKCYRLIICGVLLSIAYTPWFLQLMRQLNDVAGDYWIAPLTMNDLYLHIYYFYSPKEIWRPFTDFTKVQMMAGLIFIMAIQLIITVKVLYSAFKEKDKVTYPIIISFLAFLFPVLAGGIISIAYVPILVTRYMTCSFGLFILSLAFILAKANKYPAYRKLTYIFLASVLFIGGLRAFSGLRYYKETQDVYSRIRDFSYNDGEKQIFVAADSSYHTISRLQLIIPENDFYIINHGRYENFRPFSFNETDSVPFRDFILVHHEMYGICPDFKAYRHRLQDRYIITDSLRAMESYFYKLKLK